MNCRRSFLRVALGALAALWPWRRAEAQEGGYWPYHTCPRCGARVLVVWRRDWPRPGRHGHRHGRVIWYH